MVRIQFDINNDSFMHDDGTIDRWEIGHVIPKVAAAIRGREDDGDVVDSNGNTVGYFDLNYEEEICDGD